jgi:hypothetical protein
LPTIAGYCVRVRVKLGSGVGGLRLAGSSALDALCALENQQNPGSDSLSLPGNAASPLASRESTNCGQGKHYPPHGIAGLWPLFSSSLASSCGVCSVIVGLLPWGFLRHVSCRVRGPHGFLLGVVGTDGVIEARDLEDALVVIAETVGHQLLLLAVDTD